MKQPSTFTRSAWLALAVSVCIGVSHAQAQGTGLTGKYYDASDFTSLKTTRTDATVNFNWATAIPSGTSITNADTFSVAWSGQIEPQYSELYTFYVTADDAARLWVDDQMLVGRTFYQSNGEMRGQIRLKTGQKANIRLEYMENTGNASVKLEWASASQPRQIIPTARLYPTTEIPNGGSLMREVWTGLSGTSIATLTSNANYPNKPASRDFITSFECIAQNWEDSFGTRVTGYIRPAVSGSYTFAVSGDDVVQLYLSTDSTAANKTLIASVASATGFRQWDAQPAQQSSVRTLVAGQKYYVELLHKEDAGTDHWSVSWKQPGDSAFSIIPGTVLMQPGVDTAQPATANFFDTLCTEHPYLGVSRERFLWLKQMYQSPNSSNAKSRAQAVINSANNDLTAALQIQRAARDMIQRLALAWWLTDDTRYAEAAWNQINNSINNGDWADPWKGVEDGVVAVGYDWLYPYWSQARRTTMTNCMVNKGFSTGWTDSYSNNIGVIINSGHLEAMLAVGLVNESAAEGKIGSAISRLNSKVDKWNANAGAWYEGTDYGIFTKWGFGQAMPAMEMALGSTFGLSKIVGISATAKEPLTIASNTRQRFTFSDIGTGSEAGIGWANWFARRYNALETFDYSRQAGNSPLSALTLPETTLSPAITGINPDAAYRGPADASGGDFLEAVTMRQNWTDTKATFVGGLGGTYESHGHLQSGSFQLAARGVKWFIDLSSEDYGVTNHNTTTPSSSGIDRWDYYRWRAEGHNCLIINPTAGPDRIWNAPPAPLLHYQSAQNGERSFAIWDMSANISGVTKVQRGIQLLNHRKEVLVQDEIVTPSASTVWWYAHFVSSNTTTAISADGSSVMLSSGSERLWGKIVSGGGTWTVRPASALIQTNNPAVADTPNTGKSKLAINLSGVTNTTLAVWFVPLAPGEVAPSTTPTITPLSTWNLVAQNEAPVAQSAGANSSGGAPVDVDLRTLVTDDWTPVTQMTFAVAGAVGGTVALQGDGHTARFTLTPGFNGEQSFTFTATDGDGATSNFATITIGTTPVVTNWTSAVSGNWSTGANWQGGVAPTSSRGSEVQFFNGQTLAATTVNTTNDLAGTTLMNRLLLAGTGTATTVVNINGNPLELIRNGASPPTMQFAGSPAGFRYNIANGIVLDETVTLSGSGSGTFVFNGPISGAGGITSSLTSGTLILAGSNSYSGTTTISAGTLQIGSDGASGTLGSGDVINNGTLRFDLTGSVTVPNNISGSGGININGVSMTDVVSLTGANTFTGTVTIAAGSLRISDAAQLGDGTKSITPTSASSALRLDGSLAPVVLPPSFTIYTSNPNGAIINEAGDNVIGGDVTITAGAGSSRFTSTSGTLTIEGNVAPNVTGRGLDLRGAGSGVINGNVTDGTGANTLSGLSKNEAGTWILNGSNSFAGATTVSGGRFVINGPHTSGTVTVASGATLAGNGSLSAATIVTGTLAPGDGVGTMNFASTVSFGSASRLQWELGTNAIAGDRVISAGSVSGTSGAKIDVVLNSPGSQTNYLLSFWRGTRTWPVVTGSSFSGTFAINSPSNDSAGHATATYGSFSLQHTATGVNLVWTPIPGFPVIDEPVVTFTQPTTSSISLPNVESRLRVAATAAGSGSNTFVWSVVSGDGTSTGTATFANASAAETTVTFSEPGTYILRCTATNEAASRSSDLTVYVAPSTTVVLQEGLNEYTHNASYIQASSTAWNHGGDPQLRVGRNNGAQRAVLSFTLDGVPAGSIIRSAQLDLWTDATTGLGTVGALELHRLTRNFVEGTGDGSSSSNGTGTGVTWDTYDGTNLWSSAGGSFDAVTLSSVAGYDATVPAQQRSFASSTDFVAAAQSALDATAALDVIVLSPTTEANTGANNYSILKSNDHADTTQRPQLTVQFDFNALPTIDPGAAPNAADGFVTSLAGSLSSGASGSWSVVSGSGTVTFANATNPATTVVFTGTGTYVLRLTATNGFGEASRDLTVNVASVPPGFAAWQNTYWPGVSDPLIIGPGADPDGDGVTNSVEFTVGTNPTSSASAPTFIWNRLGSGAWSSGGSWQIGVAPASNAVTRLEFFTGMNPGVNVTAGNDIGSSFTLQSLSLNGTGSGATTITGNSINFAAGGTLNLNSSGIAYEIAAPVALNAPVIVQGTSAGTTRISGAVSGTGTLTMKAAGVLEISGSHGASGTITVNAGTLRFSGSSTSPANITLTGGTLSITGSGSVAPATGASLTLGGSAVGILNYDSNASSQFGSIVVGNGNDGAANCVLNQSNGTINATALTLNNGYTGFGAGDVNLSGGLLAVSGAATLSNQVAGDNIWSTVTVSGSGSFTVGSGLKLTGAPGTGRNAAGRVTQNGGAVTVAGGLNMARTTGSNAAARRGEYNLNGGVLNVNQVMQETGADTFGTFYFNGGTLKPTAQSATFMQGLTAAKIKTGGALIDTNGFDITIAQPLQSGTTGDGGLIKSGTGTLTLAGANTYTGATNIVAGRLALSGSLTSDVAINGGSLFAIGAPVTTGSLTLGSGGHFEVQINGVSPGTQYGQLNVGGGVSLNGTLDLNAVAGLAPGSSFTILNKTSAGGVAGAFFGKPEGSVFSASGYNWIISYVGGSGNDVVLTIATAQQSWRYQYFGTIANSGTAADTFDANTDGEANFLEFATAQNPNAGTWLQSGLVKNGANLEFTYVRGKAAVSDGVTFAVEWSDTLVAGSWSSVGEGTLQTDNGTLQTMKAIVPAGSGGGRFVRLKIVKP